MTSSSRDDARREAILSGPLRRTVFLLALPVLGEQGLNLFVAFFDTWLAGHLPDSAGVSITTATAAVGFAAYLSYLGLMVALFVSAGTTALVSRFWGGGQRLAASAFANRSLVLAATAGIAFAVVMHAVAEDVLGLLGMEGELIPRTAAYIRYEAWAYPPLMVSLIAAAALRGSGDLISPLRVLVVVNTVNAGLSYGFATGWGPLPMWGLDGIVAGTVTARWLQCGLLLAKLAAPDGLRLIPRQWRIGGRATWRILRIGLPAAADGLIFWMAHFIFLKIVMRVGPDAFAAHIVGIRVESLTYLTAGAWGAAASTMIGQNLGADQPDRARAAGHEAARQMTVVALATSALFILATEPIFRFMTESPAIREIAAEPFRLVGWFQVFLGLAIVYVAALRGAGQTRQPLAMTAAVSYLVRLPTAYLLAVEVGWGLWGAWLGMSVDMLLRGLGAMALFTFTRWEQTKV